VVAGDDLVEGSGTSPIAQIPEQLAKVLHVVRDGRPERLVHIREVGTPDRIDNWWCDTVTEVVASGDRLRRTGWISRHQMD
jgi:hypothetical protein